jgi:hypothetical protein
MRSLKKGTQYKVKLYNRDVWLEVLYNKDGKWARVSDGYVYLEGAVTEIGPELGELVDFEWLHDPFRGVKA